MNPREEYVTVIAGQSTKSSAGALSQEEQAEYEQIVCLNDLLSGLKLQTLGGHLKTGQLWTGQTRPVGTGAPSVRVFYRMRP